MRRNKLMYLMQIKRIKYSHKKQKPYIQINHLYSQWQQQYYHKKNLLVDIQRTNDNITKMISAYEQNTSVYNLKAIEKLLQANCQKISRFDQIINNDNQQIINSNQQVSNNRSVFTPTMYIMSSNVNKNMRNFLYQQIKRLFQQKSSLSQIVSKDQRQDQSFNAFNTSQNISYSNLNSRSVLPGQDRKQSLKQVSSKIQALTIILKRMNILVDQQGELINQIDQNMKQGISNMTKAKDKLTQRVNREQGKDQEEFTFHGRINKAIMLMYAVNVILIIVWVVKNII